MNLDDIRNHWSNWATRGTSILATTRTSTIKALEIAALAKSLKYLAISSSSRILEAGCGNGLNCLDLATEFQGTQFLGFDYIPEMVDSARKLASERGLSDRCKFIEGDLRNFYNSEKFDFLISVRAIINLNSRELQKQALTNLANSVRPGGHLILIENDVDAFAKQNELRLALGLPAREPAAFNLFINRHELVSGLKDAGLHTVYEDDFACLHDLLLYVLGPAAADGKIDYDSEIVKQATRLLLTGALGNLGLGIGQNRLIAFEKARS